MTEWRDRISIDPRVMVGKPCIKGTRIPVDMLLRKLSQGMSVQELLDEYPHITRDDVLAALAYASHEIEQKAVAGG